MNNKNRKGEIFWTGAGRGDGGNLLFFLNLKQRHLVAIFCTMLK